MNRNLDQLHPTIILVEPAGPINIGSVARLCSNFGVEDLRLVAPKCDPLCPEARRMALKGLSILKRAKTFASLIEAIADCRHVVATCGRIDHGEIPLQTAEEVINWILNTSASNPIGLVFGREDRGLTNKELQLAQRVITLHSNSEYPSINLSHAVAVILHEIKRCEKNHRNLFPDYVPSEPAPPVELNNFLEDAENLLLEVGFLMNHTSQARMSKVKAILQRAAVRKEEVSLIRGMLRQIRWAINKPSLTSSKNQNKNH